MPRAPTQPDDALLAQLAEVFRVHGYDGASLSLLSEATGLQRASLYHRFPGGKAEMATRVMEFANERVGRDVLAPLRQPGTPASRVREMCDRISDFYAHGEKSCLLDSLTLSDKPLPEILNSARSGFDAWHAALVEVACEAGFSASEADLRAERAIILLEGALVIARVRRSPTVFTRTLTQLVPLLTDPGT